MTMNQLYLLSTLAIAVLLVLALIVGCVYRHRLCRDYEQARREWERDEDYRARNWQEAGWRSPRPHPSLRLLETGLWLAVTVLGVDLMIAAALML